MYVMAAEFCVCHVTTGGPDWPREYLDARNGHGLCHYPPEVREKACVREGVATTDDVRSCSPVGLALWNASLGLKVARDSGADVAHSQGHRWPRPTLVKCKQGDAVLILYHTLHSSTRVDGPDPRCMVYFRITQPNRPEGHERIHPAALRDLWLEWPGISEEITEMKKDGPTEAAANLSSKL